MQDQYPPQAIPVPPTGSFPGYHLGLSLFATWVSGLKRQADIWNDLWVNAKQGKLAPQDLVKAVVGSVEAGADNVQLLVSKLSPYPVPPWYTVTWPQREEYTFRVRSEVNHQQRLSLTPFSRFGGGERGNITGSVDVVGSFTVGVDLSSADLDSSVTPGQYIGFIMSEGDAAPLAILTVHVSEPSTSR